MEPGYNNLHDIPANRVARRVVSRVPDICMPPEKFLMSRHDQPQLNTRLRRDEHGKIHEEMTEKSMATIASHNMENGAKDASRLAVDIVNKVQESCESLDKLGIDFMAKYNELSKQMKAAQNELRELRIAMGQDVKQVMTQMEDVRKFYLDDKHEAEIKYLREAVELCERAEYLMQKGFFNAFADVILRLAKK